MRQRCVAVVALGLVGLSASLCAWLLPTLPARAAGGSDAVPTRTIEFDTDEGTWMNLDVSPDGKTILFDLLGDLYTLPITGGEAKLLLGGPHWDHQPRFSPDGKQIVFVSDRDNSTFNLWLMNVDGSHIRPLSKEQIVYMNGPIWTPDGQYVIAAKIGPQGPGAVGPLGLFLYDLRGGSGLKIQPPALEPALSRDGRFLFSTAYSGVGWDITRLDRATGQSIPLTKGGMFSGARAAASPDGRHLVYARLREGVTSLRLRDLHTGDDRELAPRITDMKGPRSTSLGLLPAHSFTRDGGSLLVTIDGKIHRIDLPDGADHLIPFRAHVSQQIAAPLRSERRVEEGDLNVRVLRWPTLSPNRKQLGFSAVGKLYLTDLPAGRPRRLTTSREREYFPAFSPDGKWIAYTTWTDADYGHVRLVSPDGKRQRTLTTLAGRYGNPTWSRDGSKLAFVRGSGGERRGEWESSEQYFELMYSDLRSAEPRRIATVPPSFGYHRWFPSLAFSSDGSRLLFTQTTEGDQGLVLVSLRLDGTDRRQHLCAPLVLDLVPSPEGRRVAIVRPDGVQVASLPPPETTAAEIDISGDPVPVKQYIAGVGVHLAWHDENTLTWSIANRFFTQKLEEETPRVVEVPLTVPRAKPAGKIAFRGARIITMRGDEVIPAGTLLVEGNRIAAVGPVEQVPLPKDAVVVDARGTTLIPGLIDSHAHMHGDREFPPELKWEYVVLLAHGVTTTLDPQAPTADVFALSDLVEAGETIGPRIYSTGRGITGAEPATPFMYFGINSLEDARRVVRAYQAFRPLMLKDYVHARREQRQWLARAAREQDIRLTAEGSGDLLLDLTMVLDGYTAFEHDLPIRLYNDVAQFLARVGAYYTPTLIGTYGGKGAKQYFQLATPIYDVPKLRRFTPASQLQGSLTVARAPEHDWFFKTSAEGAAKILRAGGHVAVGGHGDQQGIGTLWEVWGIAMGGLTPLETIRVATLEGADKLGLRQDLGSLEAGKLADFLVLDANPLDDIHNLAKQRYVVKNGFVYDSESLTQLWPEVQAAAEVLLDVGGGSG